MESMTGFGNRTEFIGEYQVTVLAKSVNNKGLSLHFRLPKDISHLEKQLYDQAREIFSRGRIDLNVLIDVSSGGLIPEPDFVLAKAYIDSANKIANEYFLTSSPDAFDIVTIPGIMKAPDFYDTSDFADKLIGIAQKVFHDLLNSRQEEGNGLFSVFEANMKKIKKLSDPVSEGHRNRVEYLFDERKKRINELVAGVELDENRMMQELAVLSDRIDISEEHQRLSAHIQTGLKILKSNNCGRKLGFILTEMHRELNTMGAKVDNAEAIHQVIEMKELLGELREQVANVQ